MLQITLKTTPFIVAWPYGIQPPKDETALRKLLVGVAVIMFIFAWAIAFAVIGSSLPLPKWAELIFYATAGIGWAFLLKPLFAWLNRHAPPTDPDDD